MSKEALVEACSSTAKLDLYLSEKGHNHNVYKTYSSLERIQSWIDSDYLYLDDGAHWNDVHDRHTFNHPGSDVKHFGRCFSFSISESVAMWMLYGGMDKKGAMLELKKSAMQSLVSQTRNNQITLGQWVDRSFVPVVTLEPGQFDITLKDILYAGTQEAGTMYIKRSDEAYANAPSSIVSKLPHSVKSAAWSYENECRLILSVSNNILSSYSNVTSAQIPLMGLLQDSKRVTVYCAPNFSGTHPYKPSNLLGNIDWDLCRDCSKLDKLNQELHDLRIRAHEYSTV
jgi:hypothetical protein